MIIGVDGNEANIKNRVGSGVYAHQMLWQFAKVSNHQFLVYLKDKPLGDLPKSSSNFKYIVFGPKKLWTQIALPLKLKIGPKIDVFLTLGHYAPRFSSVPYVVTIFDLSYLHFPDLFKKDDLYQLKNWSKYSILGARHILTISQSTKGDIVKNYKIDYSKIRVTYPGYDNERFKPQSKDTIKKVKNKYKISGDYIIFVGTLQPRKNVERLIAAFDNLKLEIGNLKLVIVGKKGWLYDSIFEKVKKLDLVDKVIFTDYVANDDLPALIAGAKVYVLPSLWEGFGIPVVEAQACGVPVVVSNTSSLPEIVGAMHHTPDYTSEVKSGRRHENTSEVGISGSGVLINPESVESIAKGIRKVLADDKTRSDLVKKGFENVKRFSWQKCARQTLEALESVSL